MSKSEYTKQDAEDDFTLGFRGGQGQAALRSWSYIRLCSELESAQHGTTAYMLIEAEKKRRDSIPAEQAAAKPRDQSSPDHWYKKPIPIILFAVTSGGILLAIRYVLRTHFNVHL